MFDIRKPYPSDLTDKEWDQIEPVLYENFYRQAGSKGKYSRKEMFNAILYVLRTGCQWTDIPHDVPLWKTVYSQFFRWRDKDLFQKLNNNLSKRLRILLGKNADPSIESKYKD